MLSNIVYGFQFLGIPPKGELGIKNTQEIILGAGGFQFLGIPPKGELLSRLRMAEAITRFQFLGIPPKGELISNVH